MHIQIIVSTLLLDGKVILHSQNKYQLTLCSTALLALLKPVHYTLTFIPLLPRQLIDYIEAPTPFLIGIYSTTLSQRHQEEELQALIVHLDYDKVYFIYLSLYIQLTFAGISEPSLLPLPSDPCFAIEAPIDCID